MLKVENLTKHFETFTLDNVSFSLPEGYIMGYVGRNGAGKTTTLKCILNLIHPDSGSVQIFGKKMTTCEEDIKSQIGCLIGEPSYYRTKKVKDLADIYKMFFANFDHASYKNLLANFGIDENKKMNDLSTGMKIKLLIALAISHDAKLLILDEPTSGLDPVSRTEIMEIFRDFIANGKRSILFSTHITSDLDACADYIIMIHKGKIILNAPKDEIINGHRLIAGKKSDLSEQLTSKLVSYKTNEFGFTALAKIENMDDTFNCLQIEKPNIESIMIYYDREEIKC